MVIERNSATVEYDAYAVSEDGRYRRVIGMNATEEQKKAAIDDIKQYEESAKGVIMSRLVSQGILKKILSPKTRYKEVDGKEVALSWEECDHDLYIRKMALYAIDDIADSGFDRSDYYIFTPASEDDIKDLMVLAKLNKVYNPEMTAWNCDKWKENMFLGADSIKTGQNYILRISDECECFELFELDHMMSQFKRLVGYFSDMAKEQRKNLKK